MTAWKLRKIAVFLEYVAFMLRRWAQEMEERQRR